MNLSDCAFSSLFNIFESHILLHFPLAWHGLIVTIVLSISLYKRASNNFLEGKPPFFLLSCMPWSLSDICFKVTLIQPELTISKHGVKRIYSIDKSLIFLIFFCFFFQFTLENVCHGRTQKKLARAKYTANNVSHK